jgi:hypothetical protein
MKTLNTIRYILFAIMLLGLFANFAQNEYGLEMIFLAMSLLGIIWLIDAFAGLTKHFRTSKLKAFYLFFINFFIAATFFAGLLKHLHLPGGGVLYILGFGLLLINYLILLFYRLMVDYKKGAALAAMVSLFYLNCILLFVGHLFKIQHWPYGTIILESSVIFFVFIFLITIIKRNFIFENTQISFLSRVRQFSTKPLILYFYLLAWAFHYTLVDVEIAPMFYSLENPIEYQKLRDAGKEERAEKLRENYHTFLQNRENSTNR